MAYSNHSRGRRRGAASIILYLLFNLIRLDPGIGLLLLLQGIVWYGWEAGYARPQMAYMGVPGALDWKQPQTWTRIFRNDGYMVGYSELRGNPLWVIYQLVPPPANPPHLPRPHRFSKDWRSLSRIDHEDYQRSGYDRGHMAPNRAISVLYGREGQADTFLMTNITPQKPELNQRVWERLEEVELDQLTRLFGTVWVVTGPLFDKQVERLSSAYRVEIPDAFYKIYAIPNEDSDKIRMLAFVAPQTVRGNEPLNRFLVTVDEIEARSGLDFFADLDDGIENRLESRIDTQGWQVEAWARLAGRYSQGHTPEIRQDGKKPHNKSETDD